MTDAEIGSAAALLGAPIVLALALAQVVVPGDLTVDVTRDSSYLLTKGSAAAVTLADPGAANIGRRLQFQAGSDFAHVITTTAALANGTAPKNTWTSAAFIGSTLNLRAVSSTLWAVESNVLGTFA